MTTVGNISKMQTLFDYLDNLTQRAVQLQLEEKLKEIDITVDDVAEYIHFENNQYCRNLIRKGEHFHVLLLCWRSGHRTPIHNHPNAVGGIRVLQGIATETLYEFSPSDLVKSTGSRDLTPGGVVTLEDPYVHQVSNLQKEGNDLITLHVYSPPLLSMKSYSITDRCIGDYRPRVFEHDSGSGI